MKRFVVTVHYAVAPAVHGRHHDEVLADLFGSEHRFSLLGPDVLAVSVRIKAPSPGDAVDMLDRRVRSRWPLVGAGVLTMATATANGDLVPVGVRSAQTVRHRRRPGRSWGWAGPGAWDNEPGDGPDDDWPDDDWGGNAGVREPRRPKTPPGHLSAARDVNEDVLAG